MVVTCWIIAFLHSESSLHTNHLAVMYRTLCITHPILSSCLVVSDKCMLSLGDMLPI